MCLMTRISNLKGAFAVKKKKVKPKANISINAFGSSLFSSENISIDSKLSQAYMSTDDKMESARM